MNSSRRLRRRATIILASGAAFALLVATAGSAQAATAVGLGTADSFAVLAGAGVTNTNATTIGGNLGSANGSVIGDTSLTFTSGTNHYGDSLTTGAMIDLETAFGAASQDVDVTVSADLGGQTLIPGVYFQGSTMNLSGPELVLDAEGNADAVWIFRAGSNLVVGPGASVSVINGGSVCNVFWQVASSASLDDGAYLIGTIIARTSITLNSAASVQGRVLALDGSVSLIGNSIFRPPCAAAIPETGGPGTTETGPQVAAVPSGSVATGDGSTSPRSFDVYLLAAGVVAIGAGAVTVASRWRRRRNA
jgi:hypothetical protein